MKTVTATELRSNIYRLLDEILQTGVPLAIQNDDRLLQIVPVEPVDKLKNLIERPEAIIGDPADLVNISWESEVNLDLP